MFPAQAPEFPKSMASFCSTGSPASVMTQPDFSGSLGSKIPKLACSRLCHHSMGLNAGTLKTPISICPSSTPFHSNLADS